MSAFDDLTLDRSLADARYIGRLIVIAESATALLLQAKPDCIVAQGLRERCMEAQAEANRARATYDREFAALCALSWPVVAPPVAPGVDA